MELYTEISVFFVYLENGVLVQKHVSRRPPPMPGKKLILIVDDKFVRFTVLEVSTDMWKDYSYFVLKVRRDEIAD